MGKGAVIRSRGNVFAGFSTDSLMGFLSALGRDVEIVVRIPPRSRRRGRIRVVAV